MKHLFKKTNARMATVTITLDGGLRSEHERWTLGIAHACEHMIFKGTKSRTWKQINEQIAFLGGAANAFTSAEKVWYEISAPKENIEKAMIIINDMVFRSIMPEDEVVKEIDVIRQEKIADTDSPTYELFAAYVSQLMPGRIGMPILGTEDSISKLTRDEIYSFYQEKYSKKNAIVGLAANFEESVALEMMERVFGPETGFSLHSPIFTPQKINSDIIEVSHPGSNHAYACVCVRAPDRYSSDTNALMIADQILGGGMSSRLFDEVREKRGLVYSVSSFADEFRETGIWAVYFQTEKSKLDETLKVVNGELDRLGSSISQYEFDKARNEIRSTIYSLQDSSSGMINDAVAREFFGMRSFEDAVVDFEKTALDDVKLIAENLLLEDRLTLISK